MRYVALITLFCVSAVLVGCASHTKNYLKDGRQIAPLVVPPGVQMIKQSPYYPVPVVPQNASTKPVTLIPPTLSK